MDDMVFGIILWAVKIFSVVLIIGMCDNAFKNKILATVFTIIILALYIMFIHSVDEDFKERRTIENKRITSIKKEFKTDNFNKTEDSSDVNLYHISTGDGQYDVRFEDKSGKIKKIDKHFTEVYYESKDKGEQINCNTER
ncbi:hypothetical protein [Bacillus sp. NPDC094106]|uniref:hypothetical protein n=1 Tax=Bacillus sp. NPDC094106 TaxID=3363949 RepID=UPI00382646DC